MINLAQNPTKANNHSCHTDLAFRFLRRPKNFEHTENWDALENVEDPTSNDSNIIPKMGTHPKIQL